MKNKREINSPFAFFMTYLYLIIAKYILYLLYHNLNNFSIHKAVLFFPIYLLVFLLVLINPFIFLTAKYESICCISSTATPTKISKLVPPSNTGICSTYPNHILGNIPNNARNIALPKVTLVATLSRYSAVSFPALTVGIVPPLCFKSSATLSGSKAIVNV